MLCIEIVKIRGGMQVCSFARWWLQNFGGRGEGVGQLVGEERSGGC